MKRNRKYLLWKWNSTVFFEPMKPAKDDTLAVFFIVAGKSDDIAFLVCTFAR